MSKNPSISSHNKFHEPAVLLPRSLHSVKSSNRPEKKRKAVETPQPRSRFFITQEEGGADFNDGHNDTHNENIKSDYGVPKGYYFVNDKRVKGILGRLDSTVTKLNNAWESCEKSITKSQSVSYIKPQKLYTTFALTEATMAVTNQSTSAKGGGAQHLLSMTMNDFLSPDVTLKMRQIGQTVDLDPRTNEIRDHLWGQINKGRDYYNLLKEEIRKRTDRLAYLKERMEVYDVMSDNTSLEAKVVNLHEEIRRAEENIEMAEMEADVLHSMIYQRKEDRDLHRKRFTLQFRPYTKIEKELEKNVDEIISVEKMFEGYMVEMEGLKKSTKENAKLMKKIKKVQKERVLKDQCFEDNVEMEKIYRKKQKTFIIKTKKEMEQEQQKQREREEQLQAQKMHGLTALKKDFENNFDLLSTVSKKYEVKEEYIVHLDQLRENNEDLEKKVTDLSEEISLKRKIDLPTLQAELHELKASRNTMGFSDGANTRKELFEKTKRNETLEENVSRKQRLNTNLMRGVMTIFNNVSAVKDYLNLNKLEEIKLKLDNLGDVLLFCGEVVEILSKNRQEPTGVRSQPLSFTNLSDDE